MPVSVAVVCDELYVRSALGHATHEGEVIAYGPQSSRWRDKVLEGDRFLQNSPLLAPWRR
jgi:hypothetical protein